MQPPLQIRLFAVIASISVLCTIVGAGVIVRHSPTNEYLARLDLNRFRRAGSDFTNPRYSPLRLGKQLYELDVVFDFDFERLEQLRLNLAGVDRRTVLTEIFRRLCQECQTERERHLAVLEFCNQASFNNALQPMWPNREMVTDPLLLLELGEQRCGQTARVAADLFAAAGYDTRLVQLGGHIIAEIHYDEAWHYFDAGLFAGAETVINEQGAIPSVEQLALYPYAIDALPNNIEPTYLNEPQYGSIPYASWNYFAAATYSTPPAYYLKSEASAGERSGRDYGWNRYTVVNGNWTLAAIPQFYAPGAVSNLRFDAERDLLSWQASPDEDHDLLGYRVFIGSYSRGWCYGPQWKPEMYPALARIPPRDLDCLETEATEITISAALPRPCYVTIMPYDHHGETVGRQIYPASIEIVIE